MLNFTIPTFLVWFILFSNPAHALSEDILEQDLNHLQSSWAEAKYLLHGAPQKVFLKKVYLDSKSVLSKYPERAEFWIWHGIIASTYAEIKGGLKALNLVKESKSSLEKAISLDPNALNGSAYTSLGVLYDKVPGWPIGFGNDKKAREYYQIALQMNPDGIDSNYFYGAYLVEHGDKQKGKQFLQKALNAPDRQGRKIADEGRRSEIKTLLSTLN